MDNRDVGKTQLGHGSRDPVRSAALCVDQGEGRCTMGNSQRQARQTCARSKVGPALLWLRSSNCRQAESIIQVPLPEPLLFSRPQEPEPDRIGVDLLQGRCIARTYARTPLVGVAVGPMFHVKQLRRPDDDTPVWLLTEALGLNSVNRGDRIVDDLPLGRGHGLELVVLARGNYALRRRLTTAIS
jgi:hypothetical protein